MTEQTEIYSGIEGKILVYHSPYYFKNANFFKVISQTKKTVVVQRLDNKVVREYEIGGYRDVVPEETGPRGIRRRMFKTFEMPELVKGTVECSTKYLKLWDGTPCMEDPMY